MTAIFSRRPSICTVLLIGLVAPSAIAAQAPVTTTGAPLGRDVAAWVSAARTLKVPGAALANPASGLASGLAPAKSAGSPALNAAERLRPGGTRSFLARQLEFPRVRHAYESKAERVDRLFQEVGIRVPEVFFRVFKREQVVEVWARERGTGGFELLNSYPVCNLSGRLGPKRREGDLQIPEGFYSIDLLNPWSDYHLSMHVDYPNAVDRARSDGRALGGDIYIHGGCATVGCLPVTDRWIEEIYLIAVQARNVGQRTIPVHIFPTRLDEEGMGWLERTYGRGFVDFPFWQNLQEGYLAFERTRLVPAVGHDAGVYTFMPGAPAPAASRVAGFPLSP